MVSNSSRRLCWPSRCINGNQHGETLDLEVRADPISELNLVSECTNDEAPEEETAGNTHASRR